MTVLWLAIENPPVFHPAYSFCSNAFFCTVNYDSLVATFVSIVITLAFGLWVANRLQSRRPGKFQMVFELLIDYTRTLIKDTVGQDAMFVLPLALTLFFYILVANWIDFLPLPHPLAPANTDINQTLAMAAVVFIATQGYSMRMRGLGGYFRHFMRPEGVAKVIQVAFIPLNIIEELVKPVTLSLRLFGNILAGTVMVSVLALMPAAVSWLPTSAWKLFDLFIGMLQALIFALLTIIYFGMAAGGQEGEGAH